MYTNGVFTAMKSMQTHQKASGCHPRQGFQLFPWSTASITILNIHSESHTAVVFGLGFGQVYTQGGPRWPQ